MNLTELADAFKEKGLTFDKRVLDECVDAFDLLFLSGERESVMRKVWYTYWCERGTLSMEEEDNKYRFDELGGRELASGMIDYIKSGVLVREARTREEDEAWRKGSQ